MQQLEHNRPVQRSKLNNTAGKVVLVCTGVFLLQEDSLLVLFLCVYCVGASYASGAACEQPQ